VPAKNNPELVRREYADESGLAGRTALWSRYTGRQPPDVAFEEVLAVRPRRVLDAGCGQGQLAARLAQSWPTTCCTTSPTSTAACPSSPAS
jgi:2-polyprenyl-3-methyl-5-hydroxy-6-metoxy-1,4-benzoquinol methylase